MKANDINSIFKQAIERYHQTDHVDAPRPTPFPNHTLESLLFLKNWIDTVQWHLEDIIRSPDILPENLVQIKRRIDASNQERTDVVEQIDEWIYQKFQSIPAQPQAKLNSETPAWLLDRMSILQLKIYHFEEQTQRLDISEQHLHSVQHKLAILREQENDLAFAFDDLMEDLSCGRKIMKLYKQMKMYNDPNLNPVLYGKKES
ncbi:MAG: DUF4254 domain-containing protein [Spirosomataceae bacterium]